jgi:hypothetical protein
MNYTTIVNHYREEYASEDEEWVAYYRGLSLEDAIKNAALARGPSGEKFSHQRRIPNEVLLDAKDALLSQAKAIAACQTFDELYEIVAATAGIIPGVGELTVYDTSTRLGSHLGLRPDKVYLHAGTRAGYVALGGDPRATHARREELPDDLQVLEPYEIEDVLCIYKAELSGEIAPSDPRFCGHRSRRKSC